MGDETLVLLLNFDDTVYVGDLPVLSYLRHLCEYHAPERVPALVGEIRGFLEWTDPQRRATLPKHLAACADGYQALEAAAAAAGIPEEKQSSAYARSREDLQRSAFALDAPDGLPELLASVHGRVHVVLATEAPPTGVVDVLESTGIAQHIDEIHTGLRKPADLASILDALSGDRSPRVLAVGTRWDRDLVLPSTVTAATAYIDRFGLGDGSPTWRASSLPEMMDHLRSWVAEHAPTDPLRGPR